MTDYAIHAAGKTVGRRCAVIATFEGSLASHKDIIRVEHNTGISVLIAEVLRSAIDTVSGRMSEGDFLTLHVPEDLDARDLACALKPRIHRLRSAGVDVLVCEQVADTTRKIETRAEFAAIVDASPI